MSLKPLNQFNEERRQALQSLYAVGSIKNGIACPECGEEMFDSHPNVTLTSMPPQKNVACKCGYNGYRIA